MKLSVIKSFIESTSSCWQNKVTFNLLIFLEEQLSTFLSKTLIRVSTNTDAKVANVATPYIPLPQAIPILAAIHKVAAVVKPKTVGPFLNTVPAPIKPIPVTTCAATRAVSLIPLGW